MDLSIVVPVYNSEEILHTLVDTIQKDVKFVKDFELILVNDNSPDKSWDKIKELREIFPFIKGINLMRNYSQHNAIMAGLGEASGDVIVTMDDDLQHRPKDIELLYNEIKYNSYDVCYTKFSKKSHQKWKLLGSKFNDFVANSLINKPKDLYSF